MAKKIGKFFKRLAAVVVIGIAGVLVTFWIEHRINLTLPAPTGPYPVGRASFDWVDQKRTDPLAPQKGVKRELTVWVWYPAQVTKQSRLADYMPPAWRKALAQHQGTVFENFLAHDPSTVRCASYENAPMAAGKARFPLILMKPGIGAEALDYTTLCEDLASHGYVVVGSDSPYSTFVVVYPDGRVVTRSPAGNPGDKADYSEFLKTSGPLVETWTADNKFVLDKLTELDGHDPSGLFQGRLNLGEVGVFGHSFGGSTAAEFCHEDSRCKAGVDMDGIAVGPVIKTGLDKPFMFLLSDHSGQLDPDSRLILANIQSIYNRLSAGRVYDTLNDFGHFNFSDQCLMFNSLLGRVSGGTGKIDSRRGLLVAATAIRKFFDIHLKGGHPSQMDKLPGEYRELRYGTD